MTVCALVRTHELVCACQMKGPSMTGFEIDTEDWSADNENACFCCVKAARVSSVQLVAAD